MSETCLKIYFPNLSFGYKIIIILNTHLKCFAFKNFSCIDIFTKSDFYYRMITRYVFLKFSLKLKKSLKKDKLSPQNNEIDVDYNVYQT